MSDDGPNIALQQFMINTLKDGGGHSGGGGASTGFSPFPELDGLMTSSLSADISNAPQKIQNALHNIGLGTSTIEAMSAPMTKMMNIEGMSAGFDLPSPAAALHKPEGMFGSITRGG